MRAKIEQRVKFVTLIKSNIQFDGIESLDWKLIKLDKFKSKIIFFSKKEGKEKLTNVCGWLAPVTKEGGEDRERRKCERNRVKLIQNCSLNGSLRI